MTPEKTTRTMPDLREQNLLSLVRFGEDTALELKRVTFQGRRVVGPDRRDIDNAEVKLTLFSASGGVKGANGGVNDRAGGVNDANGGVNDRAGGVNGGVKHEGGGVNALLRIIKANPGRRVPELAQLTGVSRRTIERHLKSRLATLVEFRGPPKTGGYYAK